MSENPLEVTIFPDETGEDRAYVPLDVLPEDIVEQLRERFVPQQPTEDEAEKAPGIKDSTVEEMNRREFEDALNNPISDDDKAAKGDGPISPADALG